MVLPRFARNPRGHARGIRLDRTKERLNRLKHGVAFDEATTAFEDPSAITIADDPHSEDEDRYIVIGMSEAHTSGVTLPAGDLYWPSRLRLEISCRASRARSARGNASTADSNSSSGVGVGYGDVGVHSSSASRS
jgi:uncharacterized DUF497 family protein